jgi:hypothetical protein
VDALSTFTDNIGRMDAGSLYLWIGATIALFFAIIVTMIVKGYFSRRVRNTTFDSGMSFMSIDAMRKQGLISEEEYKAIRRKVADRALADATPKEQSERERQLLKLAAIDPDAVRELLPEEVRARAAAKESEPEGEGGKRTGTEKLTGPGARPAERKELDYDYDYDYDEDKDKDKDKDKDENKINENGLRSNAEELGGEQAAGDPLGGIAAGPPPASMNMPRVAQSRRAAQAEGPSGKKSELDLLFEKGAISREEYERLKGFFKGGQ